MHGARYGDPLFRRRNRRGRAPETTPLHGVQCRTRFARLTRPPPLPISVSGHRRSNDGSPPDMSNGGGLHEGLYRVRQRGESRGSSRLTRASNSPEHIAAIVRARQFFTIRPNPRGPRERALTPLVPTTLRFSAVCSPTPGPDRSVLPRPRRVRRRPRLYVPLRFTDQDVAPEGRAPAEVAVRGGAVPVHRRQADGTARFGGQCRLESAKRQSGEPQQHLEHDGTHVERARRRRRERR